MRAAWWRTAATTLLVSAGLFGAGVAAGAGPASATSCAQAPRPVEVVTGGTYGDGTPYLAPGDFAVVGRVTAVEPLATPTVTDSFGARRFTVRVVPLASFAGTAPGRLDLTVADRGGMYGYPFQAGRTYFIPVTQDGDLPPISLCAPIALLPEVGVDAEVAALIAAATAKGVPAGRVPAAPVPPATPATPAIAPAAGVPAPDGDRSGVGTLALVGLAGAALAVPMAVVAARLTSRRAAEQATAAPPDTDRDGPAGNGW